MAEVVSTNVPEFVSWGKTPRLHRQVVVTEKIDGVNGQLCVTNDGQLFVGNRHGWILPGDENDTYGFASWAYAHMDELVQGLGPGRHHGEWFGRKIQRHYNMRTKSFALFNTSRWKDDRVTIPYPYISPQVVDTLLPGRTQVPACCTVVPVLSVMQSFDTELINDLLYQLSLDGSVIAPNFMTPEGVIVYHTVSHSLFKLTLHDDNPKSIYTLS